MLAVVRAKAYKPLKQRNDLIRFGGLTEGSTSI